MPRCSVTSAASTNVPKLSKRALSTVAGAGSTTPARQPLMSTSCQNASAIATAPSLGHSALQMRAARLFFGGTVSSSASSPASSASRVAMAPPLLPELVGDRGRELRDRGRVDPAGPLGVDEVLLGDAAGPAREQDHPVAEADRF